MNISPFLSVTRSCDEALQWAKKQLLQAGLRPLQTFDLRAARAGSHNCPCPNHGMDDCDCQMAVVLVYGELAEPATLIVHGNDSQTSLSLVDNPAQHADAKLIAAIQQALAIKAPAVDSQS